MSNLIPIERIESKIFLIRGLKVMIDKDLADLYEVSTKRLNEQVKRNRERFPEDFMFQLSEQEKNELVAICDHLKDLKFSYNLPYAFTEQGVAMLSSVLRSKKAAMVNIIIMRAFVRLRQFLYDHKELARKLKELEKEVGQNKQEIREIFQAIKQLMAPTDLSSEAKAKEEEKRKRIGFIT